MSKDKAGLLGRTAALRIVEKLRPKPVEAVEPQSLDPLVEAIAAIKPAGVDFTPLLEALSDAKQDLTPLVKAVANLKLDARVDLAPVAAQLSALAKKPRTDLAPVVKKLGEIKGAMEENTKVLSELVSVAKMPKTVEYDEMGRIKKIKVGG